MKHTTLVAALFVLFTTLFSCNKSDHTNAASDSALPNIILLVGDDQGYPYFGFTGSDYIQTPNMDSLAASGIVFHQGYVSDNHCRPYLQTLLTSLIPIDFNKQNFAYMEKVIEEQNIQADSAFTYKQKFDRMALGFNQFYNLVCFGISYLKYKNS